MNKTTTESQQTSYRVKNVEPVMAGSDVRARLFTLAPGDTIPWHYHRESSDHYFLLEGELTIMTREPDATRTVGTGSHYRIEPGTTHQIANRSAADCRFLLLQGVGAYDWVKASD
jgi:mannose-6-phosphate isomerase-like protein (cupin superfamily)